MATSLSRRRLLPRLAAAGLFPAKRLRQLFPAFRSADDTGSGTLAFDNVTATTATGVAKAGSHRSDAITNVPGKEERMIPLVETRTPPTIVTDGDIDEKEIEEQPEIFELPRPLPDGVPLLYQKRLETVVHLPPPPPPPTPRKKSLELLLMSPIPPPSKPKVLKPHQPRWRLSHFCRETDVATRASRKRTTPDGPPPPPTCHGAASASPLQPGGPPSPAVAAPPQEDVLVATVGLPPLHDGPGPGGGDGDGGDGGGGPGGGGGGDGGYGRALVPRRRRGGGGGGGGGGDPADVVPADRPAPPPNERFFNWEENHVNAAVQIISCLYQGFGTSMKSWTHTCQLVYTWILMVCLAFAGLGLMCSTNNVGYQFLRRAAGFFVRCASILSVLLLIVVLSEPVGHLGGLVFAGCVAAMMVLTWITSYERGYNMLVWICSAVKNVISKAWIRLKAKYGEARQAISFFMGNFTDTGVWAVMALASIWGNQNSQAAQAAIGNEQV